jgi:hypothetical protein
MKIPSTIPEQQLLGVLHFRVDLTVLEESVRIEYVRVRIHQFVPEHRPFRHSTGCHREPAEPGGVPCIVYDRGTSRDELTLVHIILRQPMRRP